MLYVKLLLNLDRKRHGNLLVNLHNDYILGNNNYSTTFTKAFSLLLNHRKDGGKAKDTSRKHCKWRHRSKFCTVSINTCTRLKWNPVPKCTLLQLQSFWILCQSIPQPTKKHKDSRIANLWFMIWSQFQSSCI